MSGRLAPVPNLTTRTTEDRTQKSSVSRTINTHQSCSQKVYHFCEGSWTLSGHISINNLRQIENSSDLSWGPCPELKSDDFSIRLPPAEIRWVFNLPLIIYRDMAAQSLALVYLSRYGKSIFASVFEGKYFNISRYLPNKAIFVRYLLQKSCDISQKRYMPETQR